MELPTNQFKANIKAGKPQIGIWSSLWSNISAEVLVAVGSDLVMLARGADALAAKFR